VFFVLDVKISGGFIVNGDGKSIIQGDIGIQGDRIVAIGDLRHLLARHSIDADNLYVCPGFIDVHSHTDDWYFINPFAVSKILQGVTTEIIGNCGESVVPPDSTVDPTATSLEEFIRRLADSGIAINTATLIGHGNLRSIIMGHEDRDADTAELLAMQQMLGKLIQEGALGLSTGLAYPPGCFATTAELIALCRSMSTFGGLYATHLRDEGDMVEAAVNEAIAICRTANVRGVISHHKAIGKANWGKTTATLAAILAARNEGVDIYCDVYPYTALNTSLYTLLPNSLYVGGKEAMLRRLQDEQDCPELWQSINHIAGEDWDNIIVTRVNTKANKPYEGLSVRQIAAILKQPPPKAVISLLLAEAGSVTMIRHAMSEADLKTIVKFPYSMIGSDAGARISVGPLAEGLPHPRTYGTFPRLLAQFVRDGQVLSLPEAIRKMSALPAHVFGLQRRGSIAVGYFADLTIFDLSRVKDNATFTNPFLPPSGIEYVLVNGQIAVANGVLTGVLAGRFLRREYL